MFVLIGTTFSQFDGKMKGSNCDTCKEEDRK